MTPALWQAECYKGKQSQRMIGTLLVEGAVALLITQILYQLA